MKSLINGFCSGFGRTVGRFFFYFLLGCLTYILLKYLNFDFSKIIHYSYLGGLIL